MADGCLKSFTEIAAGDEGLLNAFIHCVLLGGPMILANGVLTMYQPLLTTRSGF